MKLNPDDFLEVTQTTVSLRDEILSLATKHLDKCAGNAHEFNLNINAVFAALMSSILELFSAFSNKQTALEFFNQMKQVVEKLDNFNKYADEIDKH